MSGRGWSRRTALRGAAALLTSSAALRARPGWAADYDADVIVLGAGLAGLGGAYLLADQGMKVLVLEASQRVGGRMRSEKIDGQIFELGASELGSNYGRVIDLANRVGVKFGPRQTGYAEFSYHIGGRTLKASDWPAAPENKTVGAEREIPAHLLESRIFGRLNPFGDDVAAWLDTRNAGLDISAADFLRSRQVSPAAIELMSVATDYTDLESTSALALLRDLARSVLGGFKPDSKQPQYGGNSFVFAFQDGAESLPRALAAKLGDRVRTGKIVTRIESSDSQAEVGCLDGSRYRAPFVLCTLPFSTLQRVQFAPELPAAQAEAITAARYGGTTHVILETSAPFWEADGFGPSMFTDGPLERIFSIQNPDKSIRFLRVWVNGTGADRIDQLPADQLTKYVIAEIERMRPAARGKLRPRLQFSWGRQPFIGGHKHVFAPGQVTRFARNMDQPWRRVHFAGEHLRRMEFGMESAMETAERAVTAILTA